MLVIGLTGGIGSGKSTVANLFAERDVPIIDADVVAREVTQPGTPGFKSIVKHFGTEILQANGTLDRSQLRHIIFNDSKQRLWLENLLHPLIRDAMQEQIRNHYKAPYIIAVIPLLLEVEFYSFINRILVVDAPEAEQIDRVLERDKTNRDQVQAILKTQARREDRTSRAHDVIINDGKLADLIPQVDKLHAQYLQMSNQKS